MGEEGRQAAASLSTKILPFSAGFLVHEANFNIAEAASLAFKLSKSACKNHHVPNSSNSSDSEQCGLGGLWAWRAVLDVLLSKGSGRGSWVGRCGSGVSGVLQAVDLGLGKAEVRVLLRSPQGPGKGRTSSG